MVRMPGIELIGFLPCVDDAFRLTHPHERRMQRI